ncbi:hypothetical protein HYV50_03640 [Candidatus Pacearchaeota archaeon]|nr:hypothetical protein [Candidatus Pacearchaeota archaeon]
MEKRTKVLVTFIVVIFLVAGLYIFTDWFSKVTGYFSGESEKLKLSKCLSNQGAEFYGTTLCAECEKQKEIFGDNFKLITYVDCGEDKSLCPNIREIPAWYINKNIHYGFKNLTQLEEISGCE